MSYFKYLYLAIGLCCCSFAVQSSETDELQSGLLAYSQRDYSKAWRLLSPLAEKGVLEAQRKIGVMYRHGLGVQKNDEKAIYWYRKAAQKGHVRAQNSLGVMYRFGMGVTKNSQEATKWLTAAAKQGDSKGQENLGLMYLDGGEGIQQSDEQAAYWLEKAAVQGQMKAQLTFGLLTLAGRGTPKNLDAGMNWIQQSANQGNGKAASALGKAYADGLYGLKKDSQQARYWYNRAGQKFQ